MAKPILHNTSIFDATKDKTFHFNWSATSLTSCRLDIYNSSTDILAYSERQNVIGKNYVFTLPANSIENNYYYYAKLYAYDIHGNESTVSNTIQFKCELSPDFELTFTDGIVLNATAFEVTADFIHDTDSIKTIRFYLLNNNGETIIESDEIIYETVDNLTYRFIGLDNHSQYQVYATCTTITGFELETSIKSFSTDCESLEFGGKCYVEQGKNGECIICSTAFVVVQYNGNKKFSYVNGKINLLNNNVMFYDEGFKIDGNFKIALKGMNFQCGTLFTASSGDAEIKISMNYYDSFNADMEGYKLRLLVTYGKFQYVNYSDFFDYEEDTLYTIWLTKKDGIYLIEMKKDEVE